MGFDNQADEPSLGSRRGTDLLDNVRVFRQDLYFLLKTVRTACADPVLTMGVNNHRIGGSRHDRYVFDPNVAGTRREETYEVVLVRWTVRGRK